MPVSLAGLAAHASRVRAGEKRPRDRSGLEEPDSDDESALDPIEMEEDELDEMLDDDEEEGEDEDEDEDEEEDEEDEEEDAESDGEEGEANDGEEEEEMADDGAEEDGMDMRRSCASWLRS